MPAGTYDQSSDALWHQIIILFFFGCCMSAKLIKGKKRAGREKREGVSDFPSNIKYFFFAFFTALSPALLFWITQTRLHSRTKYSLRNEYPIKMTRSNPLQNEKYSEHFFCCWHSYHDFFLSANAFWALCGCIALLLHSFEANVY